jgi:hypothetical protein
MIERLAAYLMQAQLGGYWVYCAIAAAVATGITARAIYRARSASRTASMDIQAQEQDLASDVDITAHISGSSVVVDVATSLQDLNATSAQLRSESEKLAEQIAQLKITTDAAIQQASRVSMHKLPAITSTIAEQLEQMRKESVSRQEERETYNKSILAWQQKTAAHNKLMLAWQEENAAYNKLREERIKRNSEAMVVTPPQQTITTNTDVSTKAIVAQLELQQALSTAAVTTTQPAEKADKEEKFMQVGGRTVVVPPSMPQLESTKTQQTERSTAVSSSTSILLYPSQPKPSTSRAPITDASAYKQKPMFSTDKFLMDLQRQKEDIERRAEHKRVVKALEERIDKLRAETAEAKKSLSKTQEENRRAEELGKSSQAALKKKLHEALQESLRKKQEEAQQTDAELKKMQERTRQSLAELEEEKERTKQSYESLRKAQEETRQVRERLVQKRAETKERYRNLLRAGFGLWFDDDHLYPALRTATHIYRCGDDGIVRVRPIPNVNNPSSTLTAARTSSNHNASDEKAVTSPRLGNDEKNSDEKGRGQGW